MVFEVTSYRKTVLGVALIPPSLAMADACLPTLVCGDTILVRLATAPSLLGFCWHCANLMFIIPIPDTEFWYNCRLSHFQGKEPRTSWSLVGSIAAKLR